MNTIIGKIYFKALPIHGVSEIGYGTAQKYEGSGYIGEALEAMLKFCKRKRISKAIADTTKDIVESQNVLERNDFMIKSINEDKIIFERNLEIIK